MKESKNIRNELVIEGTRIGVWDWNIQTGETYFNERWAEIIGYTIDELQPYNIDTWIKYAHPEDLEESNKVLQIHFQGKTEYYEFQSRMKHKNGNWVWIHDKGKVFEYDSQGNPLRMCGSHIDITAQKELEINLKKSLKEREILLKEVHHRVKNNLQILLSIISLKSQNNIINTSVIEDFVNSTARAYEAVYRTDNLDQIKFDEYIYQVLQSILNIHDVEFEVNVCRLEVKIDFLIPIGLILTELINNSLKYAFSNSKDKKIILSAEVYDNELIMIYSDNGIGYNEELLTKNSELNTFGLTIVKGLVEQLGGTIQIYNDNGACVRIKITKLPK
jgi:PAS domain S-box-containing protein